MIDLEGVEMDKIKSNEMESNEIKKANMSEENMSEKNMNEEEIKKKIRRETEESDRMLQAVLEQNFERFWLANKEKLKNYSKKELAQTMFNSGANFMIAMLNNAQRNQAQKEAVKEETEETMGESAEEMLDETKGAKSR